MIMQLGSRDRFLVGVVLILLSGVAWVLTWQSMPASMASTMDDMIPPAWTSGSLFIFLGVWSLMMVAMMLPSILPMVMTYTGAVRLRNSAINAYFRTTAFALGYLVLWSAVGLVFYAANTWMAITQSNFSNLGVSGSIVTGALLILAGVYQLTPLKDRCLTGCRTPLGFIASRWHDGLSGGFRMGLEHGFYCLGCCGAMLAVLVAFGLMNLPVMVLLTLWILAEKLLPFGSQVTKPAAAGFIASGMLIILSPSLLSML